MTQSPERAPQSRRILLAAALLLTALAAVGLLALREVVARPPPLEISLPPPTASPSSVVVHIAGEVANPGVYTLAPNTRLFEAIEAAGGATAEADLDAVNLALPVSDGQRYHIPQRADAHQDGSPPPGEPIDINVASATQLEALPGIGPVLAEAIVAHRQERGPFQRLEDLLAVSGIGPATLERLRPLVVVR